MELLKVLSLEKIDLAKFLSQQQDKLAAFNFSINKSITSKPNELLNLVNNENYFDFTKTGYIFIYISTSTSTLASTLNPQIITPTPSSKEKTETETNNNVVIIQQMAIYNYFMHLARAFYYRVYAQIKNNLLAEAAYTYFKFLELFCSNSKPYNAYQMSIFNFINPRIDIEPLIKLNEFIHSQNDLIINSDLYTNYVNNIFEYELIDNWILSKQLDDKYQVSINDIKSNPINKNIVNNNNGIDLLLTPKTNILNTVPNPKTNIFGNFTNGLYNFKSS